MMGAMGFEGTPAILYRVKSGQLGRIPGMISEKQLAGLIAPFAIKLGLPIAAHR